MKKILTVVGARPQFIKASAVSRALARRSGGEEVLVHTGQHFDESMSDIFFDQLGIPVPKYNLGVSGGGHGRMTGRQMEKIEEVLEAEMPDVVLVYGDTNSTLAGALVAVKLHIPVAHVEAGLRSFNRKMPEEINRILTDHASEYLFAPTKAAVSNLAKEGIVRGKVYEVGDVMYDVAIACKRIAAAPIWMQDMDVGKDGFVLATIHRAENTDDFGKLATILEGLSRSKRPVILPLHPRTNNVIRTSGVTVSKNIRIVPPVGYAEMTWLEANCQIIGTDSGGVQKEAYFHGKHCVTFRNETEWTELVDEGYNTLVGADAEKIGNCINTSPTPFSPVGIYGDGNAAEKIVEVLI